VFPLLESPCRSEWPITKSRSTSFQRSNRILCVWEQRRAEAKDRTTEQQRRVGCDPAEARPARRSVPVLGVNRPHQLRPATRQAARGADARQDRSSLRGAVEELDVEGILAFAERILPRASDLWCKRRSTTSSVCSSCSSRKESRTTEIDSIEPPQRHHFSTTWRRPTVLMKEW
jgi:hypothetical protein